MSIAHLKVIKRAVLYMDLSVFVDSIRKMAVEGQIDYRSQYKTLNVDVYTHRHRHPYQKAIKQKQQSIRASTQQQSSPLSMK